MMLMRMLRISFFVRSTIAGVCALALVQSLFGYIRRHLFTVADRTQVPLARRAIGCREVLLILLLIPEFCPWGQRRRLTETRPVKTRHLGRNSFDHSAPRLIDSYSAKRLSTRHSSPEATLHLARTCITTPTADDQRHHLPTQLMLRCLLVS